MRRKNAFTLIELIATIAIIAIVSLAATVTYNKIRKDVLEHQYQNLKTLIETAGVKYAAKKGYNTFFVQDLIDEGLVETDDEDYVYDPRNHDILNCHVLFVTQEKNGTYTAELSDKSYTDGGKCSPAGIEQYESKLSIYKVIEGMDGNYPYDANRTQAPYIYNGWTKYNLDLTAQPSISNLLHAKYVWNRNTDTVTIEPTRTHTTNEYGVYNDFYYLDLYTEDGTKYTAKFLYKFDNEKPTIYKDSLKCISPNCDTTWATSKTILFRATDRNGSGISRIYVGYKECDDVLADASLGNAPTPGLVQIFEVKENTGSSAKNLNVCVIDKAGNMATDKFPVKYDDPKAPRCASVVEVTSGGELPEPTAWTNQTRTIRVYCDDTHEEVYNGQTIQVAGIGCEHPYYDTTYTNTTTTGYVDISDQLGNTRRCNYNVLVDKTSPWCPKAEGEAETWTKGPVTLTQECRDDHSGCATAPVTRTYTETAYTVDIPIDDIVTNNNVCHPKVMIDNDPPVASGTCGGTYTRSSCPGGIPFTWDDPHSGYASGEVSIYYKAPGASDYTTIVENLATDANPIPGFWYLPSSSNEDYQYHTCEPGQYKFVLVGRDALGNQSDPKTCEYTVGADPDPDADVSCSNCTPRQSANTHGGSCMNWHSNEQNPEFCTGNGYAYMGIWEDEGRCPGYGCAQVSSSPSTIHYTLSNKTGNPITEGTVKRQVPWATGDDQYNYMFHTGSGGSQYYFISCNSYEGTSSLPSTCPSSSTPYRYVFQYCEHEGSIAKKYYKQTCYWTKTACIKYNNGSEYLQHSGTSYTYGCYTP